ncbi:MAG TPA: hypothetical protein ENI06_06620 [Spirochaetales bacterium]|nr:hypothetical protein [Spirochaetales bacterium]
MSTHILEKKFGSIGAKIDFENPDFRRSYQAYQDRLKLSRENQKKYPARSLSSKDIAIPLDLSVDIVKRGRDEVFIIDTIENKNMDVSVIDLRTDIRHLLLMIKDLTPKHLRNKSKPYITKYLCGHDERHWFVAAVPEDAHVKSVAEAMAALKPELAVQSQAKKGVKKKNRNKRKNKAYIRQGEWFFVPVDIDSEDYPIYKNEPLSRGRGSKPHFCEELFRKGGTVVYTSGVYAPDGLTQEEYEEYRKEHPDHFGSRIPWKKMVRDPEAYARGKVRHTDHKTISLNGWHRIVFNTENKAFAAKTVVFLD